MNLKNFMLSASILLSFLFFVLYPDQLIFSVSDSLILWYARVLPALFPFVMGINMLSETDFAQFIGKRLNFPVKAIFKVNGVGAFPLVMGLLAGYPVGAKITADLYNKKLISKEEAQCIMCFCNNPGPIFITATVGVVFMQSKHIGYVLLFATACAGIITGLIFSRVYPHKITPISASYNRSSSPKPIGTIISDSIYTACHILILVGGYIILFGIIGTIIDTTGILRPFGQEVSFAVKGVLEMTTGISAICGSDLYLYQKAIASAFFLSFGGLAIQLQISAVTPNLPISRPFFVASQICKACIASLITAVILIL